MEAVIKEIKSRFGEHKIQEMSSQELQTEVMNEIIKEKQKATAPVGMQTQVSAKPIYEEEFEQTF